MCWSIHNRLFVPFVPRRHHFLLLEIIRGVPVSYKFLFSVRLGFFVSVYLCKELGSFYIKGIFLFIFHRVRMLLINIYSVAGPIFGGWICIYYSRICVFRYGLMFSNLVFFLSTALDFWCIFSSSPRSSSFFFHFINPFTICVMFFLFPYSLQNCFPFRL